MIILITKKMKIYVPAAWTDLYTMIMKYFFATSVMSLFINYVTASNLFRKELGISNFYIDMNI